MPVVPLAAPGIAVPAFWFDMRDVRALTRARSRRHDFLTAILPVVQRIRWADKSPSARSPRCFRRRADGSTVRPAILPYRALARREPGTARSDRRPGERWSSFAISKVEHALSEFRGSACRAPRELPEKCAGSRAVHGLTDSQISPGVSASPQAFASPEKALGIVNWITKERHAPLHIIPAIQQERRRWKVHNGRAKGARGLLQLSRLPAWLFFGSRRRSRCRVQTWVAIGNAARRRSCLLRAPKFDSP